MPEVSLERGKFPLQDFIHNSKTFLRRKSGFRHSGSQIQESLIFIGNIIQVHVLNYHLS